MIRVLAVACLSLLLLGMQQQMVVHELEHVRARLARGHDVVAQNADGAWCIECSLLAAGAGAVPAGDDDASLLPDYATTIAVAFEPTLAKASPASYLSRAPPTFA
jgi:hypothetical protein